MGISNSDIGYIIGFRAANQERLEALNFVLSTLRRDFPEMDIWVVEQDSERRLFLDPGLGVKQVFVFNPGPYNRCWAFNVGVRNCEKRVYAFADADIFLKKEDLQSCFNAASDFEAITPHQREIINVQLAEDAGEGYTELEKRPLFTFAGGLLILTREAYLEIGGWDERFEGWGAEDTAFSHVIFGLLRSKSFYLPMYHIDHPRSLADGNEHTGYRENRRLAEEIQLLNGPALERHLNYRRAEPKGDPEKYARPAKTPAQGSGLKFVLALTTCNRLEYLKATVDSFLKTRNESVEWQLIIADDGSVDGTAEYLHGLQRDHGATLIRNTGGNVHHQVNTLLRALGELDFDLCFRADDDVLFLRQGWDLLYWEAVRQTGFQHLIFYDQRWQPRHNLKRPLVYAHLESTCAPEHIQGAMYTLTSEVIRQVGYFDTQRFGGRGLGHVDYSFRCCRAGFNLPDHPMDARDSSAYIQLQSADNYASTWSSKEKSSSNSPEVLARKKELIQSPRIFIPYNENLPPRQATEPPAGIDTRKSKKRAASSRHKRADAKFYRERGLGGFFGFLLKRVYNFSLDLRLFFIPAAIKGLGRLLHKAGIDLINIED